MLLVYKIDEFKVLRLYMYFETLQTTDRTMQNQWSCSKNQTIQLFQMSCFPGTGQKSHKPRRTHSYLVLQDSKSRPDLPTMELNNHGANSIRVHMCMYLTRIDQLYVDQVRMIGLGLHARLTNQSVSGSLWGQ